jgi:hypothetical protein
MKKLHVWLASLLTALVCISIGCGDKTSSQSVTDSSAVVSQTPSSPITNKATYAIYLDESAYMLVPLFYQINIQRWLTWVFMLFKNLSNLLPYSSH